ncbi:MAG: GDSL-type esterase/lipase family protein [Kiritimatiellae bacterium]|nr:GDSL-type esterase/lipase family protein [Kiritimatiellia bacterium]
MKVGIIIQLLLLAAVNVSAAPAEMSVAGDWQVKVSLDGVSSTLIVRPAEQVAVENEKINSLPLYNPKGAEYARGYKLAGVRAEECSVRYALDPGTLVVCTAPGEKPLIRGKDYEAELTWGCIGRLEGGSVGASTPVFVSYQYGKMRLDSAVLTSDGRIELRQGDGDVALPKPPALAEGEQRLGNIWVDAPLKKLDDSVLFPILEEKFPEAVVPSPSPAERLLPKTMAKLRAGERVRILAWGDSVTDAGYLPEPAKNRWQAQFVERLRQRYPKAEIVLLTEAWGGRNTSSYFNEPPGSPHNYKEKVLALKPDLIVSEFVNDAGLNQAGVNAGYGRIRDDFKAIGAEWIILTPHYVRPDWMGLKSQKEIDDDPRAYVQAVRKFAVENNIAVAEGSLRYGRLWRQGIPYLTLMMNNINHPDPFGMSLFADALMQLF